MMSPPPPPPPSPSPSPPTPLLGADSSTDDEGEKKQIARILDDQASLDNTVTRTKRSRDLVEFAQNLDMRNLQSMVCPNKYCCQDPKCTERICGLFREIEQTSSEIEQTSSEIETSRHEVIIAQRELDACGARVEQEKQHSTREKTTLLEQLLQGKKESLRRTKELLRWKKESLRRIKELLIEKGKVIAGKHENVRSTLSCMGRGGNESRFTFNGTRTEEGEKLISNQQLDSRIGSQQDSPDTVSTVLGNAASLIPLETLSEDLREFLRFLQGLFQRCEDSDAHYTTGKEQYVKDIAITVKAILDWKKGFKLEESVTYYKPHWQGHETRGAHPILFAIMFKITNMLEVNQNALHEQHIPKLDSHAPGRFVDAVIHPVSEMILRTIPGLFGKPVEIKPCARANSGLKKMQEQGENQVIGHLTKILKDRYFDFGAGLGRDGKVHGVTMTMVSVDAMELSLSGVGTEGVVVKCAKSGHLPLFDESTTKALLNGMPNLDEVVNDLFHGCKAHDGFRILVDEIKTPDNHTYSDVKATVTNEKLELGKYLGSGAFSSVYSVRGCREDKEMFIKFPKTNRAVGALEKELKMISRLNHQGIPKAEKLVNMTLEARCEKKDVKVLILKGIIGMTALAALNVNKSLISAIVSQVLDVVQYAQREGIAHMDLRPSNIIVAGLEGRVIVQVIDWGCSVDIGTELKNFRGCPPFAHDELLKKETYHARSKSFKKALQVGAQHDNASLAFTVAALVAEASVPWSGFSEIAVDQSVLDARRTKAIQLLQSESFLQEEARSKLVGFLGVKQEAKDGVQVNKGTKRKIETSA